jgi:hypothetical protein
VRHKLRYARKYEPTRGLSGLVKNFKKGKQSILALPFGERGGNCVIHFGELFQERIDVRIGFYKLVVGKVDSLTQKPFLNKNPI